MFLVNIRSFVLCGLGLIFFGRFFFGFVLVDVRFFSRVRRRWARYFRFEFGMLNCMDSCM